MNNIVLFITSGVISSCIYALLLLMLLFSFFNAPAHYSAFKDSMLSLESISIEAIIADSPTPAKDNSPTNNPLAGSGIKDMFKQVDSNMPSQEAEIGDDREKIEQNVKDKKLEALQSATQNLQNTINAISNLTISANASSDGEYDEWYAKIEEIMLKQWQKTFSTTEKRQALVHIKIAPSGAFSYKIIKYSGDVVFDEALSAMLEECRQMTFPAHPKGGTKEIATTFKN